MNILIQEQTGGKIQEKIVNSQDPWQTKFCERHSCFVCKTNDNGSEGKCWYQNCTYQITCNECEKEGMKSVYIGETKSIYQRLKKHTKKMIKENKDSVLHNHAKDAHPNKTMTPLDYKYEVTGKYKSPLERQAGESSILQLEIEKSEEKNNDDQTKKLPKKVHILNSKGEFHQPAGLVKVNIRSYFEN